MVPKTKWTILTYIAAHNDLQFFGKRSYDEIIAVGSTTEVVHGVLFDWPDGAARYIVGSPGHVQRQEQLGNYDAGDPDRLIETARWVFNQYPAEHYGLVLWSHGSGWQPHEIEQIAKQARGDNAVDRKESTERAAAPGSMALFRSTLKTIVSKEKAAERAICFDDGSGHSLDTLELGRATGEVADSIGQKVDFIGMDACLMATLEVAYQLRNSVRYLVASEELVPGHSWPYDLIFGELREKPGQSGAELACAAVEKYTKFYTENPPSAGDVTTVALDLGQIDFLTNKLNDLASALLSDLDQQADMFWKVQQEAMQTESRKNKRRPNKFDYHLWDIGSLAAGLAEQTTSEAIKKSASAVVQALRPGNTAVLSEGHRGDWFSGIGGLSIYLVPPLKQRVSPYYSDLSLSRDTKWLNLLRAYRGHYM
jgi:hypothetical protein